MLNTHGTFADLVGSILGVFNIILPVLAALGVVFFMYGVVRYVYNRDPKAGKEILWSIVALFVLFSVWGILRLMMSTFLVVR